MEASKPRHDDDLSRVRRLQGGEREAFDSFYERAFPPVFAFAKRQRAANEEAEALTEVVLATAIATIGRYRGDEPLLAWVFAIARKVALRKRCAPNRGRSSDFGTGSVSIQRGGGRHC